MKLNHAFIACLIALWPAFSHAQNLDFLNNKELSKLYQLNPTYTGVLNQFRVLSSKGEDFELGFESRIAGGKNFIGVNYDEQTTKDERFGGGGDFLRMKRNGIRLSYARDAATIGNLQIKLGADLNIQKSMTLSNPITDQFVVQNFNGNYFVFDSSNVSNFTNQFRSTDLGIGASIFYKNLIFGLSGKHLNLPDVSFNAGEEHKVGIEGTAELIGFLKITPSFTLMPNLMASFQDDRKFYNLGLGFLVKGVMLNTQYESFNSLDQIDISLSGRYKRYFVNISYLTILGSVQKPNSDPLDGLRVTLNTTLFKLKKDDGSIRDYLKRIY